MLGSTLLSAATALFFLPAVFSAPIAPVTSVSVSDASTTISTTKGAAIQKMTTLFVEKKSEVQTYYDSIMAVDTSKMDFAFASEVCGHLTEMLHDTINGVQAASTTAEDSVAVKVDVSTLIEAIAVILNCVFGILGCILKILGVVEDGVIPLVAGVLAAVISLLHVVVSIVGSLVLALVGTVLLKVDGLVEIIKDIVGCNVSGILSIVAYLGLQAVVPQ